ncbi:MULTISPECIES: hypothetical protein [Saccharopolyspora]|uniref:Uncharacterized protein n=1 Tax=Saccharopolyspora cebuensis TaxID=418759 RepID=A0ABV4CPR5_9PSEU
MRELLGLVRDFVAGIHLGHGIRHRVPVPGRGRELPTGCGLRG